MAISTPPFTRDILAAQIASGRYQVGEFTYGAPRILDFGRGELKIGSFCSISQTALIQLSGNHRPDFVTTFPLHVFMREVDRYAYAPLKPERVEIGSDVWIGEEALILAGARIGHGAVIGAGAVVASHVEPYAVVVGNPGRTVKKRFSDDQVAALLDLAWWDWPVARVREAMPLLLAADIDGFIRAAQRLDATG